jgi:RHS repeat-associated protein
MENGGSATSATPLTVTAATTFTMTAAPSSASLIQGQSVAYAITLSSSNGFTQLAGLNVAGVPGGVTATFNPTQITAGQTSILTLVAPASQPIGSAMLTVTASATVSGISVMGSANLNLAVQAPTTSFIGRTVVSNTKETPIAGVTVSMTGMDGGGNTTGCSGTTVSDAAGNFALTNLSAMCVGPQLVGFNGTTATAPPGQYAGVNLVFTLASGQVTASPVLVHLPQIKNQETFNVQQNAGSDQTYAFQTIPGLVVTVYAGTTLTMPDGSKPNPFPLVGVEVPVDRLPDAKPNVPTMLRVFIVAFQPANATASQPVAITFPNTINAPPGENMPLMTLNPTIGQMVPYGTGTVNSSGTQIVPDTDPAHAPHLYGLVHFDWHGPMPAPPPTTNPGPGGPGDGSHPHPCNACPCPQDTTATAGQPVDLASGILINTSTDIAINGPRGAVSLVRTYRSLSSNPGPFGLGTSHNYNLQLNTFGYISGQGIITLVMADGNQYPFNQTSSGTFTNTTIPELSGAVLTVAGTYNLRWPDGTLYVFQTSSLGGREAFLTAITDTNGNTSTLTLNPSQPLQITQITDPVGRSLNLAYDSSNRITQVTDPIGRTLQYTYNSQGTLATFTDAAGGVWNYAYDAQNNLTQVTDPRNIVTEQTTYNESFDGRVLSQKQGDGGVYSFQYTLLNPLVTTSPVIQTLVTDPLGNVTQYRFSPQALVTDITDASGQTTSLTRDPQHNNLASAYAGNATCAACGSCASGNTAFTLDANGNVLTQTDALGNITQFTYDPVFNKVTSITDPLGDVTYFTYDGHGNLLTKKDPNGNITSFQYDSFGDLIQTTDPLQNTSTFAYDTFGNRASTTDALKQVTLFQDDAVSRQIGVQDALGRRSAIAYDALDRIVKQTNAQNGITSFSYDAVGNLLSVTDARNNKTAFTYDPMNRLINRTDPLSNTDYRTYDFYGNLVKLVDRRGQINTFTYDYLNRLIGENYQDGSTVSRAYDSNGRLIQANDSVGGVFTFSYDLDGHLLAATTQLGTVQYTRDSLGRALSRQVVGQSAVSYSYDKAGNLLSAGLPSASATYAYDPRNEPLTLSRLNGVVSNYGYDALGRVQSIGHALGANSLASLGYAYDAVSNRTGQQTSLAQALITQPTVESYDNANRLLQAGSTTYTYDNNGNLTAQSNSAGSTTYTWDSRGRLTSIASSSGQTTTLLYDFGSNLLQQNDGGPSLNLVQTFVLDDLTNVAYVSRSDGDHFSVLAGRILDQHLAAIHGSGFIEYGLADAINSTVATVDQTGSVKGQFLYEPFGQTTVSGSSYPFQYTGRMPTSAGLYYYRARFYAPGFGRFILEDPLGHIPSRLMGEDSTELASKLNLYSYTGNSPEGFSDPSGLDRYKICDSYGCVENYICKKYVDFGCQYAPAYCCHVEYDGCMAGLDPTDPDFQDKAAKCTLRLAQCVSNVKQ